MLVFSGMRAIIFAAGLASRLGNLTKNLPKACLPLSEKQNILERALTLLAEQEFNEVLIITGHAKSSIEELIKNWSDRFEKIETIFNPEYSSRNNIYTAYLIRDKVTSGSFIFNSDIVYDPRILAQATKAFKQNPQASFMVIDDTQELVDEDMKVTCVENKIVRINKALDNQSSKGEYIGIMHLNDKDSQRFAQSLETMIENQEFGKYYEDALDRIANDLELGLVSTQGYDWTEIDTLDDYQKALKVCEGLQVS